MGRTELHRRLGSSSSIDVEAFLIDVVSECGSFIMIDSGDGLPLNGVDTGLIMQLNDEPRNVVRLSVEANCTYTVRRTPTDNLRDIVSSGR
ncbi:hypothetical protein SAMN04488133_0398 [Halobellus limi]|uniref:Uncharacterized protein n=1 Tax=Halobellus limi TaxID=699433 RepID=A0A1H5TW91_9EURY|nr:hypothetical protein [Halobellus limi]SEF67029.1 hypothetical protein SAMN04488133_0398 [Halobellus limi]